MTEERAEKVAEPEPLTRSTLVYRLGRFAVWTELKLLHRARVEGRERLPREGGVLVVSNHQSFLDIPLVAIAAAPRHVAFVARDTLARSRFLAFVMRQSGTILIKRGEADRRAIRAIAAHLKAGDCVSMFPEGTRSRDGSLGTFRGGAVLAARMTGAPIVPAGIRGGIQAFPRDAGLPRPGQRMGIRFGEPIDPRDPDAMETARAAIAELIGDGTYASMPEL